MLTEDGLGILAWLVPHAIGQHQVAMLAARSGDNNSS